MRACAGLVQFARGSVWWFFVCRSCAASLAAAGRPTRGIPCGIGALFCACACNLALGGDGITAFAQAVHLQHRSGSRAGSTFLSVYSSSPSIPLVTCRFGDAYKRRRYSTPPRRRQRVVPSASNAFLGADGSIAALRTMAIAAACAPSIHKPLRPFGHAGQGWVSAAKYARLPRCGCRQLVRGVRRAVVRLPRLPATLFCTRSALRHWAAYWQTEGRVCLGHGALRRDAGHGVEGPACESLPRRRRRRH